MLHYFSKSTQRKIQLIQLLNQTSKHITLDNIANQLNTSERNVRDDLNDITHSDMSHMFELDMNSQGYKIRLTKDHSIDSFGYYYMKNNNCFQILEYVFFNNDCTIEDLAELHHISLPTLYRMVGRINDGLKRHFNLKFQTNPCRLVGDEIEIRSFYIQYFTERYPMTEWPFQDIKKYALLDMFKAFTTSLNFKLQFSDLRMLSLSLAISHTRCNQGFFLQQRGPRLNAILNALHASDEFHLIFNSIFKGQKNSKVFDDNLTYIISEHFFFNYEEFLKSTSVDDYSAKSFNFLDDMVSALSKKYNVPLKNKEALIYNLHNSAQLGIRNINVRPILVDNKQVLLKQFKDLFPIFYNDMNTRITEYLEVMDLEHKDILLKPLLHNLATRWEFLLQNLYNTQRKINIRVISSHDIYHAKLMRVLLNNEFHEQVNVSLIETIDMEQLFSNESIDLFVTNFSFHSVNRNVVAVNDIPTAEDFNLINEIIKDIRLQEN